MFKDEDPSRYEKDAEEGRGEHYNRQKRRSRYTCGGLIIHCIKKFHILPIIELGKCSPFSFLQNCS